MTAAAKKQDYALIEREQRAFDAQLDALVREHEGEFVHFESGKPAAFFGTYDEAYRAGLDRFGLDSTFFVSEVKRREPQTTSLAWQSDVMFR